MTATCAIAALAVVAAEAIRAAWAIALGLGAIATRTGAVRTAGAVGPAVRTVRALALRGLRGTTRCRLVRLATIRGRTTTRAAGP